MKLKLNETPLRTSRNYIINNITLEDVEIPNNVKEFDNIEIEKENSIVDDNVTNKKLTYGVGKILEENILKNANHKVRIVTDNKSEDVKIFYNFDEDNTNLINQIEIIANGKLNLFIKYETTTNKKCFHNGILRLFAKENSNVNITIMNFLNEESNNFESIENNIELGANVNYTIIDIGGKNSISNYYSNISGENAKMI